MGIFFHVSNSSFFEFLKIFIIMHCLECGLSIIKCVFSQKEVFVTTLIYHLVTIQSLYSIMFEGKQEQCESVTCLHEKEQYHDF